MFFRNSAKKSAKKLDELCHQVDIFIQVHFVRKRNSECYKYNTLPLKDSPERDELKLFLEENGNPESFEEVLFLFLKKSGKDENVILDRAGLDRGYFHTIRDNASYHPTKTEVVSLCLGLRLNIEEARALLKAAGYALSNSEKSDLAIRYFIENQNYHTSDLTSVLEKLCEVSFTELP